MTNGRKQMGCLTDEQIERLARDDSSATAALRHATSCTTCGSRLAQARDELVLSCELRELKRSRAALRRPTRPKELPASCARRTGAAPPPPRDTGSR